MCTFNITNIRTEKSQFTTNNININNDKIYIITTLEHAVGNILEIEAAYNTFKNESELKSLRIVNKSVFGSSGLCLATVTVPSNLLQRLSKDFTGCALHSFTPLYFLL